MRCRDIRRSTKRQMLGDAGSFVAPGNPMALAATLRRLAGDRATTAAFGDRRRGARASVSPLERSSRRWRTGLA